MSNYWAHTWYLFEYLEESTNSVKFCLSFTFFIISQEIRNQVPESFWKQPGRFQDAVSDKEKPGTNFI
ncbi:hypothetical protein T12_4162 [Trichinella patagoniensis]|uniref:Uncharacterized protein n=1 Tax=Trichinella patagoniensis TaxID=990121 RepID=A0A0V0ZZA6_9BILA|nr:hypothetical protein T12_11346 [Trichinella patagoniensis]KRY11095.1 hypothetical protein T12_15406 [Trichinella patagoniensis]KRY17845.1 hypothetical protein T12_14221 [Trichinella patagoniensis]KRY22534.1 hypothetical protein T12_4162 [Trichinella patagoniensis]